MKFPRLFGVLVGASMLLAAQVPAAAAGPGVLVIGVDHLDAQNQQPFPPFNRLFEYTDFFSRSVKVHQGDTLDFHYPNQSFHILGVARSVKFGLSQQPVGWGDTSDPPSVATGKLKTVLNPNVFGPGSLCGWDQEAPCGYSGGNDFKISGVPQGNNWKVVINAQPGTYNYFCFIHPGMNGTVKVVGAGEPVTTQAQNDARGEQQFRQDRAQALAAERAANHLQYVGEEPGERTYFVKVGIAAADNHVAIDEMLPNRPDGFNLVPGDRVVYVWADGHNSHSVTFPPDQVPPTGWDCATFTPAPPGPPACTEPGEGPEMIFDPGNKPSGTTLTAPGETVDAGTRPGKEYGVPTSIVWAVKAGTPGTYPFNCNLHDWMESKLNVTPASSNGDDNGSGGGDRARSTR